MTRVCSIFSQILQFFPRLEFESATRNTTPNGTHVGFTCWGQFVAMLFCQLGHANRCVKYVGAWRSGRETSSSGFTRRPARSTLGYANEHRPLADVRNGVSSTAAEVPARGASAPDQKRKFRFKNQLLSLDATVIDLCVPCSTGPSSGGRKGP